MLKYNFILDLWDGCLSLHPILETTSKVKMLNDYFYMWSWNALGLRELAKNLKKVLTGELNMWGWGIGYLQISSHNPMTIFYDETVSEEDEGWVWSDWDTPTEEIYWLVKDWEEYAQHIFCFEFNTKQLEPHLQAIEQQIAQRGQALAREKLEKKYLLRLKAINHMPTFSEQTTDAQLAFEQPKMEVVPALENLLAELRQTPMDAELRTRLLGLVQTKLDAFVQGWDLRKDKPVPFPNEAAQYQAIAGDVEPRIAACQTLEDVYALIGYLNTIPMFEALLSSLETRVYHIEQAINRRIREEKGS